jgi:hypothetical protein
MSKEIGAEAAFENCRALIKHMNAVLSAEKPLVVNASTAAELLLHLESAASALRKSARRLWERGENLAGL